MIAVKKIICNYKLASWFSKAKQEVYNMYSWEITNIMEQYNYNLPSYVYLDVTGSSPQINSVTFDAYSNRFEIKDQEGCCWNFEVYNQAA